MTRLRRALSSSDAIAAAGIGFLVIGAGLAWPPAGVALLGAFLILIARTEAD